jgi:hypothetical protein
MGRFFLWLTVQCHTHLHMVSIPARPLFGRPEALMELVPFHRFFAPLYLLERLEIFAHPPRPHRAPLANALHEQISRFAWRRIKFGDASLTSNRRREL